MTCITLRLFAMPAIAAVMAATTCAASAQGGGGFLSDLFGNSDRFSPPTQPQAEPTQSQQPGQPGRVAQGPGGETSMRIDRLEAQIRQLTGAIEQLQHRNQQLEGQVRRMQGEPAARPGTAAPPQVQPQAQPQPQPATPPPGRRGDVFDPTQNPNAPGAPRVLGTLPSGNVAQANPPPSSNVAQGGSAFEDDDPVGAPGGRPAGAPLDLSSLAGPPPADRPLPVQPARAPAQPGAAATEPLAPPPRNPPAGGAQVATLPPSDSPRDSYDLAYGYILRKDYALAEDGFRNFLQRFPSDRLVPDAHYWFGESMFQRQRYRDAAEAFLNVSTKYENSARAPESLLRLGQSLAAMGERDAACASLAEALRKYPRVAVAVRQGVEREQRRVRC